MLPKSSKKIPQVFASAIALLIIYWAGPTAGQTIIGNRHSTSVSIDFSVLEQIGSTPTVPQIMQPSVRSLLTPNAGPLLMPNGRHPIEPHAPPKKRVLLSPPKPVTGSSQLKSAVRASKTGRSAKPKVSEFSPIKARVAPPASPKPPPPPPKVATVPNSSAPLPLTTAGAPIKVPAPQKHDAATMAQADANLVLRRGQQFSFDFPNGSSVMSERVQTRLNGIAQSLKRDEKLRLQLLAYAGGEGQTLSQARRMSLSRGLAIRSLLMERGIQSTRIDMRALGNKSDGGPPNRVDMIIKSR